MDEMDQGDGARDVYMKAEDLAEIERIAESWVGELPFEAVYELAKRFHFHLALKLFIEDTTGFEELKRSYGEPGGNERPRPLSVAKLLLSQIDDLFGFTMEDAGIDRLGQNPDAPDLPDKDFFENLGLDWGKPNPSISLVLS
ncbi:MAG: hypothetical protein VYC82_03030 [Verrucomicrobiota bacterium]|nr:hypothetical protein [Verrucomicrobiota bacterium]